MISSVPILFSDEVNKALAEALPSDDPFDDPEFDPLLYINEKFPDEKCIKELDTFIEDLEGKIQATNQELKEAVRTQAVSCVEAEKNLEEAKLSVVHLFKKVDEIRTMAEESEAMVMEICTEISSLDNAKKNLADSITTLKKVRDLSKSLDDLRVAADSQPPDLASAAECLYKCNTILDDYFSSHATVPRVKELAEKLSREKKICEKIAMQDLKEADITSDDPISPTIMDACGVIDACGEEARHKAVVAIVQHCIDKYKKTFHAGAEEARLEKMERRFAWFRRLLKSYEDNLATYIPASWCVSQELGVEFCLVTRKDIQEQLATEAGNLNLEILVRVLQKTTDFEKDLTARMKQYEKDSHDSSHHGKSASTIKAKWSKRGRKDDEYKTAKKYKYDGFITSCFENTMDVYVKHEGERMREAMSTLLREDPEQLSSVDGQIGANIFFYIKQSLKKCSSFCKDDVLVKMHDTWSKNLIYFATELCSLIPTSSDDKDNAKICVLINSADWCHDTSINLAEEVKSKVDEVYRGHVNEEAAADQFRGVINAGVLQIISNLNKRLTPALNEMTSMNWSATNEVGDQSPYITTVCSIITSQFSVLGNSLQPPLFRYLCDKFIAIFVPRYVSQFYKLKRLSAMACQQLLLDIQILKAECPRMPNLGKADRFKEKELKGYVNLVRSHIGRGEAILKFLGSEIPASDGTLLAEHYLELVSDSSISDFVKLLELKGVPMKDQRHLIDFLAKSKGVAQTSERDASQYQPPAPAHNSSESSAESSKEISETLKRWKGRWGDGMTKFKDRLAEGTR
ncbi:putative Membrane trafficking protein, Vps53-like [Diplonema papillatum]|nr:putative Membrane trafficking protein, Vps53-like [Diplonema papillatum]